MNVWYACPTQFTDQSQEPKQTSVSVDTVALPDAYDDRIEQCRKKFIPKSPNSLSESQIETSNCTAQNRIGVNCSITNQTVTTTINNTAAAAATPTPSFNCSLTLIALNSTEYERVDNHTILYQGRPVKIVTRDHLDRPVICINLTNNGTLLVNGTRLATPLAFVVLTYIGSSLSILGSTAILLTYSIFRELRSLPSMILMNLAAAFLVSNLLVLLYGASSVALFTREGTATMAILLHFFMLSRFSWMSLMAFETCRVFGLADKLQSDISKKAKIILLMVYLVIGWGLPLAITAITIIVNYTTDGLVLYGETSNGSVGPPWINHPASAAVAFLAPIVLALLFNAAAFIASGVLLCKTVVSKKSVGSGKGENLRYFRVIVALFTVMHMGLTWLFGFLALIGELSWAWYPFIILNSSQALWIAATFLLTKKVINLYISGFNSHKLKSEETQISKQKLNGNSSHNS